jgi:hypothetical protein
MELKEHYDPPPAELPDSGIHYMELKALSHGVGIMIILLANPLHGVERGLGC